MEGAWDTRVGPQTPHDVERCDDVLLLRDGRWDHPRWHDHTVWLRNENEMQRSPTATRSTAASTIYFLPVARARLSTAHLSAFTVKIVS